MIFCLRPKANKPNAYSKLRGRGVKMGFGFAISFFFSYSLSSSTESVYKIFKGK